MLQFPLIKFSYTTDPEGARTLKWINEFQDLLCILDSFQVQPTQYSDVRTTLKVIQRTTTLETVDLLHEVELARQHPGYRATENLSTEQLLRQPLFCVYREYDRLVSLKYNKSDGMIRRFQLKFVETQHYDQVLNWVKGSGCHMLDHEVFEAGRQRSRSRHRSDLQMMTQTTAKGAASSTVRKTRAPTAKQNTETPFPTRTLINLTPVTLTLPRPRDGETMASRPQAFENASSLTNLPNAIEQPPVSTPILHENSSNSNTFANSNLVEGCNSFMNTIQTQLPPRRELPFITASSGRPSTASITESRQHTLITTDARTLQRPNTANMSIPSQPTIPIQIPSPFQVEISSTDLAPRAVSPPASTITSGVSYTEPIIANTTAPSNTNDNLNLELASILSDLASYTALSDDRRKSTLVDSIIKHISDDNFLKLVEDLEGTWERIGIECALNNRQRT